MKRAVIILIIISVMGFFSMTACASKSEFGLKDFSEYKDMNTEIIKIKVEWDIGTGEPIEFLIEDADDIDFIKGKLLDKQAFTQSDSGVDAGFGSMVITSVDNKDTRVSLSQIHSNGKYYVYSTDEIYEYIKAIGIKQGVLS